MIITSGIISKIILETFNFFFFLFILQNFLQTVIYFALEYNQFSAYIFAQLMMKNDPKRPRKKTNKDLCIILKQFVECFNSESNSRR